MPAEYIRNCEGCPFGGPAIPGRGNPRAKLVILGEAPGKDEIAEGRPFVGKSGKLLGDCLRAAGYRNEPLLIANSMSCMPPKESKDLKPGIAACRGRVLQEVCGHPRKVIITVGNSALWSLTGQTDTRITQERGRARTVQGPNGEEWLVVPALHPAAILRGFGDRAKLIEDLRYGLELYRGEADIKDPGDAGYDVVGEHISWEQVKARLYRTGIAAADIETDGFNPRQDKVLCLGIAYDVNEAVVIPEERMRDPELEGLLADRALRWIWHNGKFDTSFLREMGLPARVDDDTMLMHYALDEFPPHGLKDLSADYLGAADYAKELKPWLPNAATPFSAVPRPVLYKYLARDCDNTLQLYHLFHEELCKPENSEGDGGGPLGAYCNVMIPASNFLQEVEAHGIYIDTKALGSLRIELEEQQHIAYDRMLEEAGHLWDRERYMQEAGYKTAPAQFNPKAPAQLAWLLYKRLNLEPPPGSKTKDGKPTTRADVLDRLPKVPFVVALLEYRKVTKALDTYVAQIEEHMEEDGRIHPTYKIHGTKTGRLACEEPNMQNIPRIDVSDASEAAAARRVRNVFVAGPDRILLEADYSQAELRGLAYLSDDNFLKGVYERNEDLHTEVAKAIWGDNFTKEQRVWAKSVNFGIAYGRTPHSIAEKYNLPEQEATAMVDAWFDRAPQAAAWIFEARRTPHIGGFLQSKFGRRRRFFNIPANDQKLMREAENEAVNFRIQSLASDLTLLAAMEIQAWLHTQDSRASVINLVHDSILVELPLDDEDLIRRARAKIKAVMRRLPAERLSPAPPVAFDSDSDIGYKWGSLTGQEEIPLDRTWG